MKRRRLTEGSPEREGRRSKSAAVAGIAAAAVGLMVLVAAVYIMVRGIGLNPDLDFGAGAYYYADIPEYGKVLDWDCYEACLPFWVYLLLFFGWGAVVWAAWKKIK